MRRRTQLITALTIGGFFVFPIITQAAQTWDLDLKLNGEGTTHVITTIQSDDVLNSWNVLAPKVDPRSINVQNTKGEGMDFSVRKIHPELFIEFNETTEVVISFDSPQTVREFSGHDEWVYDFLSVPAPTDIHIRTVKGGVPGVLQAGIQPRLYVIPAASGNAETILSEQISDSSYKISNVLIPQGQKAVLITQLPKGMIEFTSEGFWVKYGYLLMAIFLVSPVTLILVLFGRWRRLGRDPRDRIEIDLEQIPVGLVGVVKDEFVGHKDICAALFDLGRRGVVQFSQRKGIWYIERKKSPKNLLPFERQLMNSIFGSKNAIALTSRAALKSVIHDMYEEVTSQNFFSHNPHQIRVFYFLFGAVLVLAGYVGILFIYGVPLFFLGFIMLLFGVLMPQKTLEGVGVYHFARIRQEEVADKPEWDDLPWVCLFGERDEFLLNVKGRVPSYMKGARSRLDVNELIEAVHVFAARGIHIA